MPSETPNLKSLVIGVIGHWGHWSLVIGRWLFVVVGPLPPAIDVGCGSGKDLENILTENEIMKTTAIVILTLMWAGAMHAADLKIATADLQSVLEGYYKAQEVARELKSKKVSFVEELEGLKLEGRKLADRTQELQERAGLQALSQNERQKTKQEFESTMVQLRQFEIRYDDFRAQREAQLQSYASSAQSRVLEDVTAATRVVGEQGGFNLILNSSKTNLLASDVLFTKNVEDLTVKILEVLNASKPKKANPRAGCG